VTANPSLIDRKHDQPKAAAPARGVHALLAKLDAPINKYPGGSMFLSAIIGLPLLLAAGFFHLTFEEGRAAGKAMSWWEGQGMTLGFIGLSIAATPPAYVFSRTFVRAKIVAFLACLLGGLLPLPFLLGRWVHEGRFGLTATCVAAALLLAFVILARDAAANRRLAAGALALATIAVVFAFGANELLSLWLPLGAVAWVALPTIGMKALRAEA
jgi:hypothetical protein